MTRSAGNGHTRPVTVKSYITGFALAVILTVMAFTAVSFGQTIPRRGIVIAISVAALAQVFVHLRFFLHLDSSQSQRWNLLSLLFTLIILIVFVAGTLWVLSDLNYRME